MNKTINIGTVKAGRNKTLLLDIFHTDRIIKVLHSCRCISTKIVNNGLEVKLKPKPPGKHLQSDYSVINYSITVLYNDDTEDIFHIKGRAVR